VGWNLKACAILYLISTSDLEAKEFSLTQFFGMKSIKTFSNCKLCIAGKIVEDEIHVDSDTGRFVDASNNQRDIIDLYGKTVAPGYLELQSNVGEDTQGHVVLIKGRMISREI
jgi:hypothetical protein